jgi:RNA-directed DNA polymerase
MSRLEKLLGLDRRYLRACAVRAGSYYSPFPKESKPRPFQKELRTPKLRVIDNPSEKLKAVQSLINERLLKPVQLPTYICGGVKGKSVLDNVRMHQNARVLIKIDIKRFFPSITNRHIFAVWRDLLGCSPRISGLLTQLTTFERHLPQGAPTSTLLANFVLHSCDGPIRGECDRLGIVYSSWVDDLPFSSNNPRQIISVVARVLAKAGFKISRKKLEILGPGERKILNGVLMGRHLSVPPDRLSRIRSGIHKLRQSKVAPEDIERYAQSLRGNIAYVTSIARRKGQKLREDLDLVSGIEPQP